MTDKISIESILDIYNPNIVWFPLSDEYKGYEYSNTGIMRSMKFYKKYPYGIQIKPDKDLNFELSNCFNQRVKIYYKDLPLDYNNFRPTIYSDRFGRNPIITSKSYTITKNKKVFDKESKPAKFTIIQ